MVARLGPLLALLAFGAPLPATLQDPSPLASASAETATEHTHHHQQSVLLARAVTPLADDPSCTPADRVFIERSYQLARQSVQEGGFPFGAVLVVDGAIVAEYRNSTASSQDPTRHAELGLISTFAPKLGREAFRRGTLYASSEPCIMCVGAILNAGLLRVVYGTTQTQFQRVIGDHPQPSPLTIREIIGRTNPAITVKGPLLEKEGLAIHESFWPWALRTWGRDRS
ncbi:nucleoside deaminase [Cyanobium sp. Morenito 9A2]|uniref:nucleoside deaminase n=1 Tax=Cyanobium sp. Morenito 9A2 TaxID=2823718 RepID=UPI0020CD00DF|nr:nucleoside deaminase [Cyanobium sp. Morenito 9A2]MCP9848957.1 nucleoside deaminase [Cyanobium sp. Morenito 9A2]